MKLREFKKDEITDCDYVGSLAANISVDRADDVELSLDVYNNGDEKDAIYYDLGLTIRTGETKMELTLASAQLGKLREAIDAFEAAMQRDFGVEKLGEDN